MISLIDGFPLIGRLTLCIALVFRVLLNVLPEIIAGSLRWERKDYRIIIRMVGSREVRKLFSEEPNSLPCDLFGFNNGTALLTLIAGHFLICCRDFFKVIPLVAAALKTFRATPPLQFLGGNGQMTVPAAQPAFLRGQQDQMEMSARFHMTSLLRNLPL